MFPHDGLANEYLTDWLKGYLQQAATRDEPLKSDPSLPPHYAEADASGSPKQELLWRFRRAARCLQFLDEGRRAPQIQADALAISCERRLGHFEIREQIGAGSHGIVYRAYDACLNRDVALKVPRPEVLVSDELRARFLREGKAAARLDHPNVLSVYEAGEAGGVCYIASALTSGLDLREWLTRQRGSIPAEEAAGLVGQLAEAVESMHCRGVLHRDIKPSNILLEIEDEASKIPSGTATFDRRLVAKLTDFGLAKVLLDDMAATRSGVIIGTPRYMAPEQAAGERDKIGPATDVYGLGVTLYELLAGRPPYRGETDVEALNQVLTLTPVPPCRIRPDVPRDLETVCLKAMAREPERRYQSAADLADDLHRFCSGEPIAARPVGAFEKTWRWCRRKPAVASLLASLVLVVLAGLFSTTWLWQWAEVNRRRAEANFRVAHEVVRAYDEVMFEADTFDDPEFQPMRKAMLDTSLKYYRQLLKHRVDDRELLFDIGEATYNSAFITASIGSCEDALAIYKESLPLWERLAREHARNPEHRYYLAKTHRNIGILHRGDGRLDDALRSFQTSLALHNSLVEDYPGKAAHWRELAYSHLEIGQLIRKLDRHDEALAALQKAQTIFERLVASAPTPDIRRRVGSVYYQIGHVHRSAGRLKRAAEFYRKARDVQRRLIEQETALPGTICDLAKTALVLGVTFKKMGDTEEPLRWYRDAYGILEPLVRRYPSMHAYERCLGKICRKLGDAHASNGRFAKATDWYHRARKAHEQVGDRLPNSIPALKERAAVYEASGRAYSALSQPREAARWFQDSVDLHKQLLEKTDNGSSVRRAIAEACFLVGLEGETLGERADAQAAFEQAVVHQQKVVDAASSDKTAAESLGRYTTALRRVTEALPTRDQ